MKAESLPANILVTGASGQLGSELKDLSEKYSQFNFLFAVRSILNIGVKEDIEIFFEKYKVDYCINCAAYTAVDKAESDTENAFLINSKAVKNLAEICKMHHSKLIHISTDYVYDGSGKQPMKETDPVAPLNVYGKSKLEGEQLALAENPDSIIVRTSWVYSAYGHNFVKTMMRLLVERTSLNVVEDQVGSPTYAADLSGVLMTFITSIEAGNKHAGIFNYSNYGITSWFQFAQFIKELTGSVCEINPVLSEKYQTAATRPSYSVLDTSKIRSQLNIEIPFWKESVTKCIRQIQDS